MLSILYKPSLLRLRAGELSLKVPFEDDAFQLATPLLENTVMGNLLVCVEKDAIRISQEGGQALQVEDNDIPSGLLEKRKRFRIFASPIAELALTKIVPTKGAWLVQGEGLDITEAKRFKSFMTQIFISAYGRQNPEAGAADIMTILDQSREF